MTCFYFSVVKAQKILQRMVVEVKLEIKYVNNQMTKKKAVKYNAYLEYVISRFLRVIVFVTKL